MPPPGPHGGDAAAVARALGLDPDDVLDLSQSLNPVAPDPVPVLRRHLDVAAPLPRPGRGDGRRWPRPWAWTERRLLLTNGGAEAIAPGGRRAGRTCGRSPSSRSIPAAAGPLWRSNPHNPSGLLAGPDERAEVWDEAFYPLATGSVDAW